MIDNQKKRILVVCQHFWPETFRINEICDYFVERGYEVDILCGIPNYPKGKFFDGYSLFKNRNQYHNGLHIQRAFEIPRGNSSTIRIILNNLSFSVTSVFHIPRLLTKKYDKIFIYQLSPVMMAFTGIAVGKIKRIETTMWVIDLWPENLFSFMGIKNGILKQIATYVSHWHYKNVDKIVALTNEMGDHLKLVSGLNDSKVIALPQTCEKIFEAKIINKEIKLRFKNKFKILFTGTITPILRLETMLEAAKILNSKGLKDIDWIIVGDGMSLEWLKDKVSEMGLSKNFHFEGMKTIQEIPLYTTNAADLLFSCLSKDERLNVTMPAKIISYLAVGKPIVLAMDGVGNDLVNSVRCGLAGPAEDEMILAQNIERFYKMSSKDRKKYGERGLKYYYENIERNIVLDKLDNFIFD